MWVGGNWNGVIYEILLRQKLQTLRRWRYRSSVLKLNADTVCNYIVIFKKAKCSLYRPCVAQRVGRGIALLFHDCGTRRGRVVSVTPRPHFIPGKELVPIVQEAWWASGSVWTGGKCRPHRNSISDRPARSQSLYRLSYPAHNIVMYESKMK